MLKVYSLVREEKEMAEVCNFKHIVSTSFPTPILVGHGTYHYALNVSLTLSLNCGGDTPEMIKVEGNGYIHLAANCVASLGDHVLRNPHYFSEVHLKWKIFQSLT